MHDDTEALRKEYDSALREELKILLHQFKKAFDALDIENRPLDKSFSFLQTLFGFYSFQMASLWQRYDMDINIKKVEISISTQDF